MSYHDLRQPDALLFDMDGVIAGVGDSYRECIVRTASDFGCELCAMDIQEAKRAGGANNDWDLTRRLLAYRGFHVSLEDVVERFQSHYLGGPSADGLREREALLADKAILRRLTARFPAAVVTGRPGAEARWFLDRFGLSECFRLIVAMEDAPEKPSPAGPVQAISALSAQAGWMIGDTPDDMVAARAAGLTGIGIVDVRSALEPPSSAALLDAGASLILTDINDLELYLR